MIALAHQGTRRTHSLEPVAWDHRIRWTAARLATPDLGWDWEGATLWLSPSRRRGQQGGQGMKWWWGGRGQRGPWARGGLGRHWRCQADLEEEDVSSSWGWKGEVQGNGNEMGSDQGRENNLSQSYATFKSFNKDSYYTNGNPSNKTSPTTTNTLHDNAYKAKHSLQSQKVWPFIKGQCLRISNDFCHHGKPFKH